jgi:AraC-like DNA-binding protein
VRRRFAFRTSRRREETIAVTADLDAALAAAGFALELFDQTPAQLIIRARLDAARAMLRDGDEAIGRIALACAYCDQSAFARQFKAAVGLTPARYRERAGS